MYRPRNKRMPTVIREITERQQKVLVALERYDHLDTKHLSLLTGLSLGNIKKPLRDLFDAGLIERPPNNGYRRDRLKDPQVHKRTALGTDWLERHDLIPHRAIYRAAGGQPPHDLAVAQLLVCIELAHREAGLRFITADEILADAPRATKDMKTPFRFETDHGFVIPDAVFSTEYESKYQISFVEVNLSDHGEKAYKRKAQAYGDIIFGGIYKKQLALEQYARVLTFDTSMTSTNTMMRHTEDRDPSYFKLIPTYGRFEIAPPPVENILDNWRDIKGHDITLKEPKHGSTRKTAKPVRAERHA